MKQVIFLLFTLFTLPFFCQKQKSFSGKLVYKIEMSDTALRTLIPERYMTIYTNDTLLRIENTNDQTGKQTIIKHLALNKSYLLIDMKNEKYAIQFDHNLEKQDSFPYQFNTKFGKRRLFGYTVKRAMVSHKEFHKPIEFTYIKSLSSKYLNTFENAPGLPIDYYIASVDGIYHYQLIQIEKGLPERDLFGIPSNYKKMSFEEFMQAVFKEGEIKEDIQKD